MTRKLSDDTLGFGFIDRRAGGWVRERMTHPRTPDGRPAETEEELAQWWASDAGKAARIREIADSSLEDAWAAFEEAYGVKPTDPIFDFAFASVVSQAIATGDAFVKLKVEAALALWLRRGGRPAGRIALSDLTDLMTRARRRKREIMDEYPVGTVNHVKAPDAEVTVAQELLPESAIRTVKSFVHKMKRPKLWKPETRKRPRQG